MDSNTETQKLNKNILIVRLPANVKNAKKAVEMLGGKDKIMNKFIKDEDLELNLFNKKINLEKCLSNDFLIRRKRLRNKLRPDEFKYTYEIVGKVDSSYDYFALHDYICIKDNNEMSEIKNLEKFVIHPEEMNFEMEQENPIKKVKKIIQDKIEENGVTKMNNVFTTLQPDRYSYARNSYSHVFKQLRSEIKFNK